MFNCFKEVVKLKLLMFKSWTQIARLNSILKYIVLTTNQIVYISNLCLFKETKGVEITALQIVKYF